LRTAVHQLGLEFGPDRSAEIAELKEELAAVTISRRNNGHSLYLNRLSPACRYCNRAEGSTTFILSLACNRECFFCTNRNQQNYEQLRRTTNDVIGQFDRFAAGRQAVQAVALTGGEPLLYPEKCLAFFRHVKAADPGIHTRLYTNGDLATERVLSSLSSCLDEIRLGLKADASGAFDEEQLDGLLTRCNNHIPQLTVELPVLPDSFPQMAALLDLCNEHGVFSVNLLEFLFPWHHADWYRKQGYRIKNQPYQVIYNYEYAGGLPVDGSEVEALRCLLYAGYYQLPFGVQYCSLENKLTSQIYQQNKNIAPACTELVSQRDHFLKSVRFLGVDADTAYRLLKTHGVDRFIWDTEYKMLECHPDDLHHLRGGDISEAALTYAVAERTEGHTIIREVHLERIDPRTFDPSRL